MWLGIELTHRCNLNHPMCDHRVKDSSYELTWEDFGHIARHLWPSDKVVLVGGEPLVHPRFEDMAQTLLRKVSMVQVKTNGLPLSLYDDGLLDRLDIILQRYPGENDAAVRCYGDCWNVTVREFKGWNDPDRDPNLDEAKAKKMRAKCGISSGGLRVYGQRLYSCCLSEAIERHWQTEPAHVPFDKDWRDWERIPCWRACQHCFRVIDWGLI